MRLFFCKMEHKEKTRLGKKGVNNEWAEKIHVSSD